MKKGTEKIQTDLNWVNLYLKNGGYPPGLTAIEKRIVRKRAEQFCFMNDELYFLGTMKSKEIGQGPRKVLLTYEERWDAVNKAHVAQDGTHLGHERTLEQVTDKYYWVGISKFARDCIRQCLVCLERNRRLGIPSGAASVTEGSIDDGSSITGEDTLSLSGTEVVSTMGDNDQLCDVQYSVFTRETAKAFWEMVDLRLYGPFKTSQKMTYILMALDGYSLWPEAFILDTVSPATIAQSVLKLICRYGQMGKLVMSQEDDVLETVVVTALDDLKKESVDITLTKTIVENTGDQYDEFDYLLEQFIATHPKTWPDCIDFCLLPLRTSCIQGADYTPSFLAHSREIQFPQLLQQYASNSNQPTEGTIIREPSMTEVQKKQVLDMMMRLNEAVSSESSGVVVMEETFRQPQAEKIVERESAPQATSTPRAIVTRAKSGLEKPKQFDQSFVTPVKRKAATIVHATSDPKKVKVEIITDSSGETYHVSENADCGDGGEKGNFEEALEIASNSEKDLSAVAQSGTKLTVDLDHFYKCIKQYLTNQTYFPNTSFKFKTLIREASAQYRLVDTDLYFKSEDAGKLDLKVITSKEERLQLLEWAHIGIDKNHQSHERMLEDLKDGQVHWKGKSLDCESFAQACPDCDNCSKDIKQALKNMQEEKKLISYDTTAVYEEIRMSLRPNIYPNAGKSLDGIKKYLNSFKIEGDQLIYVTDMKKKRVVTSAAERVKLIAKAHLESGKHQDVRYTLSKVFGNNFWFGMKIDIKVFVNYCCNDNDGKCLNDRYFMFRSYFMKKNPIEPMGRIVQIRAADDGQLDSGTEDQDLTEEIPVEDATVDIAGNVSDDTQEVVVENMESVAVSAPTGIFMTSSESSNLPATVGTGQSPVISEARQSPVVSVTGQSPVTRDKSDARVTVLTVEGNRITEKGDAMPVTVPENTQVVENREPQKVHIVSRDSKQSFTVNLKDTAKPVEAEKQNVVVEMNERGDHAINIKLEKVVTPGKQQTGALKDSDPVTMAAVKSILPDDAGTVANVLNEIEVGGEGNSPVKVGETSVEMRDSSMNTTEDLVVNESELLDDSDDDDDDDDEDGDETIEVATSSLHSELLSRLTETLTPVVSSQGSGEDKKVVTPRQHYKCNICNRVFYGPNKFKTHLYRHTGQKPFPCTMCNKKYTNNKSLMIHERTHTGELPFLCNTCGKRMPSKVSLKSHLKVHDGKGGGMPCKCDVCGREFTRRHLMERHKNFKHINVQTEFQCTECPKVFGHQRSLKRHFMSHHMGVKNHVCDLCGKAFFRKEYLTSHKAQHAGLTIEMAKRKRQELRAAEKMSTSMHYVKEDTEEAQQERDGDEIVVKTLEIMFTVKAFSKIYPACQTDDNGIKPGSDLNNADKRAAEPTRAEVRRIVLHQDEDGTLRVVDLETEHQVRKILATQLGHSSQEGETMVVQIQQPTSPTEQHVLQIEEQGREIKQQVIEIQPRGSEMEQQVIQVDQSGTPIRHTVVEMEDHGQAGEVVEVPVEGGTYVEYQPMEESPSATYITVGGQTNLPTSYPYTYTSSQSDVAAQSNQELMYGQPAVQYEVECVGDVGDEEALSAINLLAQASAAQYENVVSQI